MTNQLQLSPTNDTQQPQPLGNALQFITDSSRKLQRQMALIATLNFDFSQPTLAQKPAQTIKLRSIPSDSDVKVSDSKETEMKVKRVNYIKDKAQLTIETDQSQQQPQTQAPASPKMRPQRQIKYLGLCIEKDEEYEEYPEVMLDPVERIYYPIRENYIEIVKHCRRITFESIERKGRSDLKRTARSLMKTARKMNRRM